MARDTGPQCKQCRREGMKLFLKGERCLTDKCAVERRNYPPGDHGRGRSRQSEYRLQLREKQKARRYYGVLEKQFRNYYAKASRQDGRDRRESSAAARDPLRQRARAPRLRRFAAPGAPDGPPRPLGGQRPPRGHPVVPAACGRRDHHEAECSRGDRHPRRHRADLRRAGVAPGRPRRPDREGAPPAGTGRRSPRRCRNSSSSSFTRSSEREPRRSPPWAECVRPRGEGHTP